MNNLREAFWAAYDYGFGVIPLSPACKDPPLIRWSAYKRERADVPTIRSWLARWPNANPAIVTGRVSGVIVLDADGLKAKLTLAAFGGIPVTWTVKTRNGFHYYFHYPHPPHIKGRIKNFVKKVPGLDLRADGGYVMAPGAIHPDGGVYAWVPGLSPDNVPLADPPAWLKELLEIDAEETEESKEREEQADEAYKGSESECAMEKKTPRQDGANKTWENARTVSRRNSTGTLLQTYGETALHRELEKVSRSPEGARNDQLNRSAFALGQLVASDVLDEALVERELETAARSAGLDRDPGCGISGIRATIQSGLRAGMRRPRQVHIQAERTWEPVPHYRKLASLNVSPELPMIDITNRQLRDITTDALKALVAANDPPVIFLRSGDLVRVRVDEHRRLRIEILCESHMCGRLARVSNFVRYGRNGEVRHVPPPLQVVHDIMALGTWSLPPLEGLLEAPTLRPDGSILDTTGYDAATHLLYMPAPGLHIPAIPKEPDQEDVQRSLALLDDTFGDFPYVDEASRANMFALLLTPIVRQSFKGHVPLALLDAPRAGTGKTLVVEAVSQMTTGRTAALMSAPAGDEEFRKRLTSVLLDGPTVITIDNVESNLASPSFASVLTAHNWHDRMLGSTSMVTLPQRATWIATGNNIKLGGDMPRRCYWIRLDSQLARPWQRPTEGFRHPDLLGWISERRGELLAALLTMARAWHVAGKPAAEVPPLGSFEAWARTLGGILAYSGVKGFLRNLDALYEQNDEETSEWEAFLAAWSGAFGERTVTVAELCDALLPGGQFAGQRLMEEGNGEPVSEERSVALREALPGDLADGLEIEQKRAGSSGGSVGSGFRRKLGKAFARRVDVRYGDLRLKRASDDLHSKVSRWRLRDMRGLRD